MTVEELGRNSEEATFRADVAIVGAGPAGIVTALEIAKRGLSVVLIESGQESFAPGVQDLSEAACWNDRHAPMTMAIRRQVGGTSTIWGGRCVPYDPIDFESRPFIEDSSWPIKYENVSPYFQRACEWSVCGRAVFDASLIPGLPKSIVPGLIDEGVTASSLERWSLPTDFGKTYLEDIRTSKRVRLLTGATVTKVNCVRESGEANSLSALTDVGGQLKVVAKAYVIACGGLEGTRLLMSSQGPSGGQLGDGSGHLGRWYMAHAEGVVANVKFKTPPSATVYGYERDVDGVYIRRRFGFTREFQMSHELPNVTAWLTNPPLPDAAHKSGQLSFVYLALSSRFGTKFAADAIRLSLIGEEVPGTPNSGSEISPKTQHLRNIASEPKSTAKFVLGFGSKRLLARTRKVPGYSVYNRENLYPLQYHGEHRPHPESRVTLSRSTDRLGRPKLDMNLRFSNSDFDGIARAHEHWDRHLQKLGIGQLEYLEEDVNGAIDRRSGGGFHQIGTTRMSALPKDGVVDTNLAVHEAKNVFVSSSSNFVTSSQANSTLMIVVFAVRLADHLSKSLKA